MTKCIERRAGGLESSLCPEGTLRQHKTTSDQSYIRLGITPYTNPRGRGFCYDLSAQRWPSTTAHGARRIPLACKLPTVKATPYVKQFAAALHRLAVQPRAWERVAKLAVDGGSATAIRRALQAEGVWSA
jgi:hypothetical protein